MKRQTIASLLVSALLLAVSVSTTHAAGKIVVVNDDWVLSNTGFTSPNDPGKFATNVAAWFTGGQPGKFHAYSDHFGLTGSSLASAMTNAGHTWTTGTTGFTFDLATLQKYDGIFLLVAPAGNNVLIDYVEAGGNVYLAYCGDSSHLDEQYNTFVNHFGLGLGTINNGVSGNVTVSSTHPIFAGVDSLYNDIGSDIADLEASDPRQLILIFQNDHGLYAFYDEEASFCDSTSIVSGETKTGEVISGSSFTNKYFFCGNAGDRVIINAVTTSGTLNTNVCIYPPSGGAAEACGAYGYGDQIDRQLAQTGLYTIRVQDHYLSGTGVYSLSFMKQPIALVQISSNPAEIYQSLQDAYNEAVDNDGLLSRNVTFSENFTLNGNINVTLKGGLQADFTTVNGYSHLHGILTLSSGSLMVENLVIK